VLRVVHNASSGTAHPAARHKRGGLRSRFATRSETPEMTDSGELTVPDPAQVYLPLTHFGNVTLGDSVQLSNALRAEALTWPRPTLSLAGGTALEFSGDESVWAKIDGDIDALKAIGRGVPQIVQRLGFFVDRRQFRPWLAVATITDSTTAPYLQKVVDALESFEGTPWTVTTVQLMKRLPEEAGDAFELMEEMPLAEG
jgi:2'-5' RNA ligase